MAGSERIFFCRDYTYQYNYYLIVSLHEIYFIYSKLRN